MRLLDGLRDNGDGECVAVDVAILSAEAFRDSAEDAIGGAFLSGVLGGDATTDVVGCGSFEL